MVRRVLPFLFPVLWMVFIFFLSSQPVLPGPNVFWVDFLFKKVSHISVYAVLFLLWYLAILASSKKKQYLFPFLLTLAYAISDEFHQSLVPGRTPSIRDVGYDSLGMLIAYLRLTGYI